MWFIHFSLGLFGLELLGLCSVLFIALIVVYYLIVRTKRPVWIAIRIVGFVKLGYQTIRVPYEIKRIQRHLLHVKHAALRVDQLLTLVLEIRFWALLHWVLVAMRVGEAQYRAGAGLSMRGIKFSFTPRRHVLG